MMRTQMRPESIGKNRQLVEGVFAESTIAETKSSE
jgi:hypothetical protein